MAVVGGLLGENSGRGVESVLHLGEPRVWVHGEGDVEYHTKENKLKSQRPVDASSLVQCCKAASAASNWVSSACSTSDACAKKA